MRSKISIIIAREFWVRLKKKSFILSTILFPIILAITIITPIYISSLNDKDVTVFVLDDNDYFINKFTNTPSVQFKYPSGNLSELKQRCITGDCDAVLHILSGSQSNMANLFFYEDVPTSLHTKIEEQMNKILFDQTLVDSFHIDPSKFEIIKQTSRSSVATVQLNADGKEKERSLELSLIVGMICAIIIYFFIFMHANQVMHSTIEEKSNRIIEIIISSVRPFDFMMGKIVGIALYSLVQFGLQILVTILLIMGLQMVMPMLNHDLWNVTTEVASSQSVNAMDATVASQMDIFSHINSFYHFSFTALIICFVLYFLLGYFTYSSLFAGVGSTVDIETDTSQFILPLSIPLFIAFVAVVSQTPPQSTLIWWLSMIPLTSPIVMMYRLPMGVPMWELVVSLVVLAANFIFCVWLSAKVYRTSLLIYGKKVSWRDLWKMIKY